MVLMNEFVFQKLELQDHIESFLEKYRRKSDDTYNAYKSALELMSKNIFDTNLCELRKEDLEMLSHDALEGYKTYLLKMENSNTTINNRISAIKSFIRYLASYNAIVYNISKLDLVEPLPDESIITEMIPEGELYLFTEYFVEYEKKGLEKKWAALLLLETGNRSEEVLSANKNQFIKDGDTYIFKSKGGNRGKRNKDYYERIGKELYHELMMLNPESEKVFSINYKAFYDSFKRANNYFDNELIRYTPHSIKHLSVTLEYRYTGCILAAQRKGKHSSIETTRRYLRVSDNIPVGAYTRKLSTKNDMYKQLEKDALISIIESLPSEYRDLINMKANAECSEM